MHQHGTARLEQHRVADVHHAPLLEHPQVENELVELGGRRLVADRRGDLRTLHDVAKYLPDQVPLPIETLERGECPAMQLGDRVDCVEVEQLATLPVGDLDRFADQRVLGPEMPEERDLVEVRLLGNPPRGGTPVARLGVHTGGYFQQFFPGINTHGRLGYIQFQRMQAPAYTSIEISAVITT